MRLSFRFLVPLALALFLVAYAATPFVEGLMRQWHMRDLDIRATLVANSLQDALYEVLAAGGDASLTNARLTNLIRDTTGNNRGQREGERAITPQSRAEKL